MQTPAGSCAVTCSPASRRKQQRTYPNVDSTRSCHLGRCWHSCPFPPSLRECSRRHPLIPRRPAAAPQSPRPPAPQRHPVAAKVNLNTATVAELDKVSQIGPARSKAIVEARAKEKFKNWDDFVARKVVPADAAAAMKDVVSF